jgi:hypothetical protein
MRASFPVLGLVAGFLWLAGPSVAQSPAPGSADNGAQIKELQRQVRYLYDQVAYLKNELRKVTQASTAGGGQLKGTDAKLAELQKKFESHTHDMLQEGRASDGSARQVTQEEFGRSGLNATGLYRVGKPKFQ